MAHLRHTNDKESSFKELLESSPVGILRIDEDGSIIYANEVAGKILGLTREELTNTTYDNLIRNSFGPTNGMNFNEILSLIRTESKKDNKKQSKWSIQNPEETGSFITLNGRLLHDGEGNFDGIVLALEEITEPNKFEGFIEQYGVPGESSVDPMAACDIDYNYLFANQAYMGLYQVTRDELYHKKAFELIGRDTFETQVKPNIDKTLKGEKVNYRMERNHPELGKREFSVTYYPLKNNHGVQGVLGTMQDVTEIELLGERLNKVNDKLRTREAKYQKYFEELGDAIFVLELGGEHHGRVLEANSTAEEQTGYARKELVGMNLIDQLVLENSAETNHQEVYEKLARGETVSFVEKKKSKNGTEYWTEVVATPIEYRGKQATISINRDITERMEAQQALHRERDKLKQLHEAVEHFQRCQSENELCRYTLEVIEEIFRFDIALIYLTREEKLVPVASTGFSLAELPVLDKGEGLVGKTIESGQTFWGNDSQKVDVETPESTKLRSHMTIPVGKLGVLQVGSNALGDFSREDVELTEILANHLHQEIKRARLEEELKEQAIRDHLTGLHNRRYFNEAIEREVEKCKRSGQSLFILMIDIDRFKAVNDKFSHKIGDRVLEEVATLLKENVRASDIVVRYGGDEFLIVMPETGSEAKITVSRLKKELESWSEDTDLIDFTLTFSLGVSQWNPGQNISIEETLQAADRRMYEDKDT